jgi:hypothetical protein
MPTPLTMESSVSTCRQCRFLRLVGTLDHDYPGMWRPSVQNLLGVSMDPPRPDLYKKLLGSEPVAVIGYSIRVYRLERPWW